MMSTDKNEMYSKIKAMRNSDWIAQMAFRMLDNEELEDKEHVLMAIVIEQAEVIKAMKITQERLVTDYYRGVKACSNYAEIQSLNSTTTNNTKLVRIK